MPENTLKTQKFGEFYAGQLQPKYVRSFENNNTQGNLSKSSDSSAYTQFTTPEGDTYYFVPENYITRGYVNQKEGKVYSPTKIFKPENIDYFLKNSEYVDLSQGYGDFMKSVGQNSKGFLIKEDQPNPYQPSLVAEMLRPDKPIGIRDKLTQQILGQGMTGKWTGQGHGSPEANARVMAATLESAGISDIRDFGKVEVPLGITAPAYVQLKDPKDPSKGGTVSRGYDENGNPLPQVELTPEQIKSLQPQILGGDEGPATAYTLQVPVVRETFGNKLTNTPIQSSYSRRGGNIFDGTFTGKDSTGFGVQFAPDGTPVFYTQKGASTSSWGEVLPVAAFALNFVVPGAGAALGGALGITNAALAAGVGNAIISGAMAEAAGGDFWKAAAGSAVSSAMAGAGGMLPSTGSAIIDKAIAGGVSSALTGGDPAQGALNGAISAGINEFVPSTGNKIADAAISSGIKAALTGGDVGQAVVSGAMSGAGSTFRDQAKVASSGASASGDDMADTGSGGAGSDEIDTRTVTDEDGTQYVYDQDNNLIDIITGGAPAEMGVSTDTSGAAAIPPVTPVTEPPAVQPPVQQPETGVSTDTSGAEPGATQPPATQEPAVQPVAQEPETGVSTDTSGAEPGVSQSGQQPTETGVSTDTSGAEPGAQPPVDQAAEQQPEAGQQEGADDQETPTCAPGYTWDSTRQICVPDDDERQERADTGLDEPAPSCADGYTWDEARQICVPNDDPAAESQECPPGYIYDLGARACVKATSASGGSGGGRPSGGTSNAGGATGGGSLIPTVAAAAGQPISRAIVDEPMRRIGLPIYEKMSEFEGPLSDFLEMVQKGSYISKPGQPEQPMQQNMNQPMQPDRLDQPATPQTSYFNYGQESSIDNILNPDLGFKAGGMASPLMAAGGTTRYGMNSGGALNVVHHSGKPRLDFREGAAVTGEGDGQSDDIPAMLADGEFVFPADVVAALGNGSTKAGSDKLYEMMHSIRAYHRSAKPEDLPPPAKKSPLDYLKKPAKKARK